MCSRPASLGRPVEGARAARRASALIPACVVVGALATSCSRPPPAGEPAASAPRTIASADGRDGPSSAQPKTEPTAATATWNLLALDTASRTYVAYVRADTEPSSAGAVSGLARSERATDRATTRALPFTPGDVLDRAAIMRFLPVTRPAEQSIDANAPPYSVPHSPGDATLGLQRALAAAGVRASPAHPVDVLVGPGVYEYHAVLDVPANVRLRGDAATLRATDPASSAIHLAGSRSGALFLKVEVQATKRLTTPDSCGIWVGPRRPSDPEVHDTLVVGNDVSGTAGAQVFGMAEAGGLWAFNHAHAGFADAFHHTGGSHDCQVVANRAEGSASRGDDLYAFIGYAHDGDPVHHCSCIANYGANSAARGIAAVGAGHLWIEHNVIDRTQAAGIYIARESAFTTYGSFSIWVRGNHVKNANLDATHDGLLAFADHPDDTAFSKTFGAIPNRVRDLDVRENVFEDTSPGRGGGFGIQVRSSCSGGDVVGNVITRAAKPAGLDVSGASYSTADNTVTSTP